MVVHQVFAALWVGGVVFVALAVLPLARDADVAPEPLEVVIDRLVTLSRLSAVILLLTGLYVLYTAILGGTLALDPLLESGRGHLVLTMLLLWLGLMATIEIGSSRLRDGLAANKLREPAREALPWYRAAAAIAVLVSGVAGLLSAGVGF